MRTRYIIRWVVLTFVALILIYTHALYTGRLRARDAGQAARWRISDDLRHLEPDDRPFFRLPVSNDVFLAPMVNNNLTRAMVVARRSPEDISWITKHLSGDKFLEKYIFVVDDPKATWKVPENKGHEAMVYLSYIIQRYDSLPDVSIFMHYHEEIWHNNDLLRHNAVSQVQRLSPQKVIRDGYMNIRCHQEPGCDKPLRPGTKTPDPLRNEEPHLAKVWPELFPDQPVPTAIRQPCCAQFAVSRDRIRSLPKSRYEALRTWLLETTLDDATAGRIFEYAWHFLFARVAEFCPSEHVCYCDGYGICFEGEAEYKDWFERKVIYHAVEQEFWDMGKDRSIEDGKWLATEKAAELRTRMYDLLGVLKGQWADAIIRGNDPKLRAKAAGRPWKPGDGY